MALNRLLLYIVLGVAVFSIIACDKSSSNGSAQTPGPNPYDMYEDDQVLDPYVALNGMGQWVNIDNTPYFAPNARGTDWQPYQNGYWTYDQQHGNWTWVSHDQWGWMTDHYGTWRHHSRYGWIWRPFEDLRYEPHCVTWFDDGEYIGWYPYHARAKNHYRHGRHHGFDDGYWEGYQAAVNVGSGGFKLGFTVVNRQDVTYTNISQRRIRDDRFVFNLAYRAHSGDRVRMNLVGSVPGGDRRNAYNFIQGRAKYKAHISHGKKNQGKKNKDKKRPGQR